MSGFGTLLHKEVLRFWKVGFQTIAAPVLTSLLYLLIFSSVLDTQTRINGIRYMSFLIPGLVMMSVLQNAFANSSSSLIQSKVTGSVIFVLLPPIGYIEFFMAYMTAAALRGVMVGFGVFAVTCGFSPLAFAAPGWIFVFFAMGGALMGAFGIVAGIWADKFDQLAGFQNFLIMPLTMLSGVFYSIHSLPAFWQKVSHFNPIFYMIDGFRYGFFGVSDAAPELSLVVGLASLFIVAALALLMLRSGYKLRY
ncbi:MAG: ABC transporter permease [Candidatus Accumulibacter sp.]|jgi:ABC-2 type transport system permease protein|nr:ABC transporter permease [Accumulibacter sp.]